MAVASTYPITSPSNSDFYLGVNSLGQVRLFTVHVSAMLSAMEALNPTSDQALYWTGIGVPAVYSLTPTGRSFAALAAGASGGVPYFSAANTVSSSAALTAHGVLVGGGAGAAPAALGVGATKSLLQGATGADPAFTTTPIVAGLTVNANAAALQAAFAGTVLQVGNADATKTAICVDTYAGPGNAGHVVFRKANGTAAGPTQLLSGELMGGIYGMGWSSGSNGFGTTPSGFAGFSAAQNITDTARGTRFSVHTTANGTTSLTEKVGVENDGILTLTAGIKFPATQNASSDVNTLDDYEEGSWTPVMAYATPGTSTWAGVSNVGNYTKIGRLVALCGVISGTPTVGTGSGALQVTGVPFTAANISGQHYYSASSWQGVTKAGYTNIVARVISNTATVDFAASGSGQSTGIVLAADTPGTLVAIGFDVPYFSA